MDYEPVFSAQSSYPPVQAERANPRYARAMLQNMAARDSETSCAAIFFYASIILGSGHPNFAEDLRHIAAADLHHLDLFGQLAFQLGAEPRLWMPGRGRPIWWWPGYCRYSRDPRRLLRWAAAAKKHALQQYQRQCQWIRDPHITALLQRVSEDEQNHLETLGQMLETFEVH